MSKTKHFTFQIIPEGKGKISTFRVKVVVIKWLAFLLLLSILLLFYLVKNSALPASENKQSANTQFKLNQLLIDSLELHITRLEEKSQKIENIVQTFISPRLPPEKERTTPAPSDYLAQQEWKDYVNSLVYLHQQESADKNTLLLPDIWPLRGVISKKFSEEHPGLDLVSKMNHPIMCTAGGVVVEVGWKKDLGVNVHIMHPGNIRTVYAHLNRSLVKTGDYVEKGSIIGTVGTSGNSTGPHLHYEILIKQQPIDPLSLLFQ